MIDRLHSLEAIIKRLTVERDLTAPPGGTVPSQTCEELTPTSEWLTPDAGIEQQFGRLIVEDTRSHYISNVLWANLANEVCMERSLFSGKLHMSTYMYVDRRDA